MLELFARARQDELAAAALDINHRIQWEQISRVVRLERALKKARARIFADPQVKAGAH
jgi:hypothetical protein